MLGRIGSPPPRHVVGSVASRGLAADPPELGVVVAPEGGAAEAPGALVTSLAPAPEHGARGARRVRRMGRRVLVLAVGSAMVIGVQLSRPLPGPAVHIGMASSWRSAGSAPSLPWPATGEAAVAVPSAGVVMESGPEPAVPIASLAKIMTGYIVLRDHPIGPGAPGPAVAVTAGDQLEAAAQEAANDTAVPVQAGEVLTERQLLDGLLVHSANNLADVLARWDAGSLGAFVDKMNATAAALGMRTTHYADASGIDVATTGSAADQLLVTEAAMTIPAFEAVVAQPAVILPLAGALPNYVKDVGTAGIVGVKSGFTQAAMGCVVLAGQRWVAGRSVLVLAAVTGQPGATPLDTAQQADMQLIDAVAVGLRPATAVSPGATVGRVSLAWTPHAARAVAARGVSVLAWPGEVFHASVSLPALRLGAAAGSKVGTLSVSIGSHLVRVPVRITAALPGPSLGWRLEHG